ncbi:MAG: hypothetical protein HUJ30_00875, partial [Gammaproteobacteria bacterium]|nr:hypothetical protein [Gammaproteobacteria bacterium]
MSERTFWAYWFMTVIFLAVSLLVFPEAIYLSMMMTVIHGIHFFLKQPEISAFPMQVRIGYLGFLALGQVPFLGWFYWIMLAGGMARLTTGYCLMARLTALMPWNRSQPMSWHLLGKIISAPSTSDILLQLTKGRQQEFDAGAT